MSNKDIEVGFAIVRYNRGAWHLPGGTRTVFKEEALIAAVRINKLISRHTSRTLAWIKLSEERKENAKHNTGE